MIRSRLARPLASLTVLLVAAALASGCGSRSRELQPGSYRAVLELPGGELPFGLDVAQEESGVVLYLVNGEERVRVSEVEVADGQAHGENAGLREHADRPRPGPQARGRGGAAAGRRRAAGAAAHGRTRPDLALLRDAAHRQRRRGGRWSVTFTSDEGGTSPGVAEFVQTIRARHRNHPDADRRPSLPGRRGLRRRAVLSRFDGASAYLYRARLDENGGLSRRVLVRADRAPAVHRRCATRTPCST